MVIGTEEVRRGLENHEFVPFFQPLVALRTGQLAGFEVLARWQHPMAGVVLPERFIAIAEQDGSIGALTQMLLCKAFVAARGVPEPLTLSVNISPLQLRDLGLAEQIQGVAEAAGFPLNRLVIEITESALVDNLELAQTIADELKALGCRIALDDFGTGYSSLLHLQSLPFDELKVDRSFVSSMVDRQESRKIVGAVVGLGQSLGLKTVAEGVESREQAEMLLWMGCELGQGWLFGRPVGAEGLTAVVTAPRGTVARGNSKRLMEGLSWSMLPIQRLAQLQALHDGAPVGLGFLDRELRYVNMNQRLAEMNGAALEEHRGKRVEEMIPWAFPTIEPYLRRALQGEGISGLEVRTPSLAEKEERTALVSYEPARDEVGEVIGVSVAVVDITARKAAEAALRESEDHYRHMVDLNPQTPWVLDPAGQATAISARWEQMTGMSAEASRGRGFLEALHPEDRRRVEDAIEAALASGTPIDVECRIHDQKNGGWRWVRSRGAARRDASGQVVAWYGGADDIDDRKRAEEALRRSEAQLKAIFNAAPVGILLAETADSKLRLSNPEAKRIFGEPAVPGYAVTDDAMWGSIRVNGKRMEVAEYPLARALRGEKTLVEEALCLRGDGTEVWVSLMGAPIFRPDGTVDGGVVVIQDIDRIKREKPQTPDT